MAAILFGVMFVMILGMKLPSAITDLRMIVYPLCPPISHNSRDTPINLVLVTLFLNIQHHGKLILALCNGLITPGVSLALHPEVFLNLYSVHASLQCLSSS